MKKWALLILILLYAQPFQPFQNSIAVAASPQGSAPKAPTPLPPGTSTLIDPSNATLYPKCASIASTQALAKTAGVADISVAVPSQVFGTQAVGQPIIMTDSVYANGTVVAKDASGDEFGIAGLTLGSGGTAKTTLWANSTVAEVNYLFSKGRAEVANVTVTYGVKETLCQPSGLEIRIAGSVASGSRRISLHFLKPSTSNGTDSVWFGKSRYSPYNTTSAANRQPNLGFDWSDSALQNATYIGRNETLTYRVKGSFSIDPTVVVSGVSGGATATTAERKVFHYGNEYLVFYSDGTNVDCRWSANGSAWSAATVVTSAFGAGLASDLGMWMAGDQVFYALASAGGFSFQYGVGLVQSGCSIDWLTQQNYATNFRTEPYGTSVMTTTNGTVYVAVESNSGCYPNCGEQELVFKSVGSNILSLKYVGAIPAYSLILLPLTAGIAAVTEPENPGNGPLAISFSVSTDGGYKWSSPTYTPNPYDLLSSSAVSIGNTVYLAAADNAVNGGGLVEEVSYTYPSSQLFVSLLASGLTLASAAISTDGSSFAMAYSTQNTGIGQVWYSVSVGGFVSWTKPVLVAPYELNAAYVTSTYVMSNGTAAFVWDGGSPNSIRFMSLPVYLDPAVAAPTSWSKPGLSPYESYFSGLTEFVSPGNGLLGVEQTDYSLPGRGLDLAISRVYSAPYSFRGNSAYQYDNYSMTNLGMGWSLNFPWLGTNYVHLTDGQAIPYAWSANGTTMDYHGAVDFRLIYQNQFEPAFYQLQTNDGVLYTFGLNRSLLSITDPTGKNVIRFDYQYAGGYVSKIVDSVGRTVTFYYEGCPEELEYLIADGVAQQTYAYSGNNLVSSTDALGRVTKYSYGGPNDWLLKQISYPTGGKTTYSFVKQQLGTELTLRLVSGQNVYGAASNTSLTRSTSFSYIESGYGQIVWCNSTASDGYNVQGATRYDFQGSKLRSFEYDYATAALTLDKVTEDDYDVRGQIVATKLESPAGVVLSSASAKYDNWGNLVQSTDDYGETVYYSYANTNSSDRFNGGSFSDSFYPYSIDWNIRDALVGTADFQNLASVPQETYYKYNYTGLLLETKQLHNGGWILNDYTYDRYGNLKTATDPLLHTTHYQYSGLYDSAYLTGQSILVGGKNVSEGWAYDFGTGRVTSSTDGKGNTTSYSYDAIGRLTLVKFPAVSGVVYQTSYAYNDVRNTVNVTDEDGHLTEQFYDGLGNLLATSAYNGSKIISTESMTYNWQGQVGTVLTPNGNVTSYSYDYFGRPTRVTNPDGTFTKTSYDDVNNVVTVVDENGNETKYNYDRDQRLSLVQQYLTSGTFVTSSYVYDGVGNLLTSIDPNNFAMTYKYDDLNRLVSTVYADGNSTSTTYESNGNVATTTDARHYTVTYSYDELNRLTLVSYPNGTSTSYTYDRDNNIVKMADAHSTTTFAYDALNRLTKESLTIGGSTYPLSYAYDGAGNVVSTKYPDGYTLPMTYDVLNRLKTLGTFAKFTYTADSQVATIKYGDGQVATYSYTKRDQPKQILVKLGAAKQMDLNYTYDKAGNVLTIGTEKYGYDALDRLTSSTGPWGSISYAYDAAGNRLALTQNGVKTSYSYNKVGELKTAGTTAYSYDSDGNMVKEVSGSTTMKYAYDYQDDLVTVTKVVGSTKTLVQKNVFDGMGRRVEQVAGGVTTVYMYQGTDVIYYKAGSTATKLFYADGMQIARITGSTTYYYHEDELGSVRLESTSTGGSYFSSNYEPYGPQYGVSGSDTFRYADEPFDSSTGLYYMGERFYDPTTGRFLSRDPAGGPSDDPQSMNAYAYARDNPLGYVDPTGMFWWSSHHLSQSRLLAAGAVALGIGVIFTGGADLPLLGIDLAALGGIAGTAAITGLALTGLPLVALGTEDESPSVDELFAQLEALIAARLERTASTVETIETVDATRNEDSIDALSYHLGVMGNAFIAEMTGGSQEEKFELTDGRVMFADIYFEESNSIDENKVGGAVNKQQLGDYTEIIGLGKVNPGFYHMLLSPITGRAAPSEADAEALRAVGFTPVVYNYDWWDALQ